MSLQSREGETLRHMSRTAAAHAYNLPVEILNTESSGLPEAFRFTEIVVAIPAI